MAFQKQVARRISRLYLTAIALIALLTLVAQGFLQLYLYNLGFDSREVNLAGKMRMLSQRTVKLALLMERGDHYETHLDELAVTTQELSEIFAGLANGSEALGLQAPSDAQIEQLLADALPVLELTISASDSLIRAEPGSGAFRQNLSTLIANDDELLTRVSRIPAAYDQQASDDIRRLQLIEIGLLLITLTVLLLELLFIFRPITRIALDALTQVEEDAIKTERLKRLAAMGEMSGGIAHELNSPLAALSFAIQRLQRRMRRGQEVAPGELVSQLDNMASDALRMGEIVQSVRALAAGALPEAKQTHPAGQLLRTAIDGFRARHGHASLPVAIAAGADDVSLYCVGYQIEQVLINLLKNAAEATQELAEPWVELSAHETPDGAIVTVVDAGTGIPEPVAERAFDPFFSTKGVGAGMGLGLALCQKLIELHGGRLSYDLVNGHTTFMVFLPAKRS